MKKLFAIPAALAIGLVSAPLAQADPPEPGAVQCREFNGARVCRYPDGHVQACNLDNCAVPIIPLSPKFWDQPAMP